MTNIFDHIVSCPKTTTNNFVKDFNDERMITNIANAHWLPLWMGEGIIINGWDMVRSSFVFGDNLPISSKSTCSLVLLSLSTFRSKNWKFTNRNYIQKKFEI